MKTASSLALFLVVTLGLTACGDDKKNKRHQTEAEKVAEVVPQQNDISGEAEKKAEENQQTEAEKKAEEAPKNETPAVEPAQPEAPVVEPTPEPTPEPTVVCTMEVKDYCVQTGKGQFETVQFGRSGPECKFPEAPANTVDAVFCSKGSDSKSL